MIKTPMHKFKYKKFILKSLKKESKSKINILKNIKKTILKYKTFFILLIILMICFLYIRPIISKFYKLDRETKIRFYSTIFGSVFALAGGYITQTILNAQKQKEEFRKNALSLYFDITKTLYIIKKIYIGKTIENIDLPYAIDYDVKWAEKCAIVSKKLSVEEINTIYELYIIFNNIKMYLEQNGNLQMISYEVYLNNCEKLFLASLKFKVLNYNKSELEKEYYDITNVNQTLSYKYQNLICKLKEIANV